MAMSAKAKNKPKNNETTLADAVAIAGTPETAPPASEAGAAATITTDTAPPPARPSLLLRARTATSKAVVTLFASVRSAQSVAVKRSLAWITTADAGLEKSLLAGEHYLLTRLGNAPAPE